MSTSDIAIEIADRVAKKQLLKKFPEEHDQLIGLKWEGIIDSDLINIPANIQELHKNVKEIAYEVLLRIL